MSEQRTHGPLAGRTFCYVSTEAFGGLWRTYKQAVTLWEAGASIVIVGYRDLVPAQLQSDRFEVILVDHPLRDYSNPAWLLNAAMSRLPGDWPKRGSAGLADRRFLRRRHRPLVDAIAGTRAEVVQAVDLPSLDCAHEAAVRIGAKLVYASHELWAGFVRNPDLSIDPVLATTLLSIERDLIGQAGLVLVTSDQMGRRLSEIYGVVSPVVLLNSPPQRVEHAHSVASPVRLVFHGGLSADRNIGDLIQAMALLAGRATLDIHGFSRTAGADDLQALVDSLGLGDAVKLHGRFEYHSVVDMLSEYDIGVMANRIVEENFDVTLPNKVFDCMCAGLAIAMTGSSSVKAILEEVPYGIALDPTSPESIARELGPLVDDSSRILAMKRAAVAAAPRYWWPEQGHKLVTAMQSMLESNTSR